jgi:hypothetical protein
MAALAAMAALAISAPQAGKAPAVKGIRPTPKIAEAIRGTFDMSKNPRPWIGVLILDQIGNPYPTYCSGGNAGGTIVFDGRIDELDETFSIKQTGSFSVDIVHTARKHGMFDQLPAGSIVEGLGGIPMRFVFESFTDPVVTAENSSHTRSDTAAGSAAGGGTVEVTTAFSGTISVGTRKAPLKGTAYLSFMLGTPCFNMRAEFTFPGKELGLLGSKGEGITGTLYTASVTVLTGSARPEAGTALDGKL